MRLTTLFASLLIGSAVVSGRSSEKLSIVSHIEADSIIDVIAPDELLDPSRVVSDKSKNEKKKGKGVRKSGYRVLVYSEASKSRIDAIARDFSSRFRVYRTHIKFQSPYWHLRVGDFETREEADEAASRIRAAFPIYRRDIKVVRDRVSIIK